MFPRCGLFFVSKLPEGLDSFHPSALSSREYSPNAERSYSPSIPCGTHYRMVEGGPPLWCAGREAGGRRGEGSKYLPLDV
ncbi:hypothetical protein A0H81_08020 [Grifola frondosa]|uniref:Uncharacterized protein n=1 Tax=Grifola frondosa TaxID=5627 RepID=A0A1C7M646_GRIFR|nr:hypothetical protein A0H81_08020 [Grifola frondosa]